MFVPAQTLTAQGKGSVHGIITDALTGEPLMGVNIAADRRSGTISDLQGTFTLELEAGPHVFEWESDWAGYHRSMPGS